MSSDGGRKILLRSSDGETFAVEEVVALQMQPIKHMIEDKCADQEIPLPNVTSLVLSKVIEYCKKHAEACDSEGEEDIEVSEGELYSPHLSFCELLVLNEYSKSHCPKYNLKCKLKAWDTNFVKVDHNTLFDLILAANYLNIKSLLHLTCQAVADLIKGKTPEEIRGTFNLKTPMTPEEEEEVRRENQWAFE